MAASMSEILPDPAIVVYMEDAQKVRHLLEQDGVWDSSRRLQRIEGNMVAIPIKNTCSPAMIDKLTQHDPKPLEYRGESVASGNYHDVPCHLLSLPLPPSKKRLTLSPHQRLVNALQGQLRELDIPLPEEAQKEIPDVWEKHGDLILLPEMSFRSSLWERCDRLWETVAMALGAQRVARKGRIKPDEFRSPTVDMLLGQDGWVEHRDNGIRYTYDIRHCMFSAGNVTEKLRVAGFNCDGETVVDLYAGIGYFTLPYLVHARASVVHACEWNPDAISALEKNLTINNVRDRCIVHQGDNRQVCPKGVADRVNLGLIPTSEEGWPVACAALKPQSGGMLHIHGNVTSRPPRKPHGASTSVTEQDQAVSLMKDRAPNPGRTTSVDIPTRQGDCTTIPRTTVCESVGSTPTGFGTANPNETRERRSTVTEYSASIRGDLEAKNQADSRFEADVLMSDDTDSSTCLHAVGKATTGPSTQHETQTIPSRAATRRDDSPLTCPEEGAQRAKHGANTNSKLAGRSFWAAWADRTVRRIQEMLTDIHGGEWTTEAIHIQHVKSYAPHVDHLVVDVQCTPSRVDVAS